VLSNKFWRNIEMISRHTSWRTLVALVVFLALFAAPLSVPAGPATRASSVPANSSVKPFPRRPSRDALKWADKELRRMTVEQKIGQLISVAVNATFLNQDSDAFRELKRQVEENHVGGIILFRGPVYESVVLMNRMQQLAKYPLLISADLEAGAGMRFDDTVNFPWNMADGGREKSQRVKRAPWVFIKSMRQW